MVAAVQATYARVFVTAYHFQYSLLFASDVRLTISAELAVALAIEIDTASIAAAAEGVVMLLVMLG